MMLAFQCGEWDLDAFGEMPKEMMDRWEQWFHLRPQGQYHRDRFQAFQSSLICASNGSEIEPSAFMYYEKKDPEEELTVDEQWEQVAHLIPQSPSLKNEVKQDVESREHGDEPDCGCEQAYSGNQHCQGEQSGLIRLD